MSRLTELIRQAKENDPSLGAELEREYRTLSGRRAFGLNFERHRPEAVELPGRPVRRGDKVRILPPRGSTDRGDRRLWRVTRIEKSRGERLGRLRPVGRYDGEVATAAADDLVVVAEFRDPIYPGLVPTGSVQRGGDKPAHTVINGENFHALKALTFTHRGKVDAIYIDPPYNTGAKDWKYNNDYVEGDDLYRHSKWLAFMERRLLLAKGLLNPDNSVLIVTIDEKEYLRLGLLLEQTFPEARIQMVSSVTNRKGSARGGGFSRVDEYLYYVALGSAVVQPTRIDVIGLGSGITKERRPDIWNQLMRRGSGSARSDRPGLFYPVYVDPERKAIVEFGAPLRPEQHRSEAPSLPGLDTVLPMRSNGEDGRWSVGPDEMRERLTNGFVKVGTKNAKTGLWTINYLISSDIKRLETREIISKGRDEAGAHILEYADINSRLRTPKTIWNIGSHDATEHGKILLTNLLGKRSFPFPKSVYAVEDALRFFVSDKPDAVVLDFFAGSGTTAHAVMRLNRQDSGRRQCISVTNNEVSADEHKRLRKAGQRPGDPEWEALGICDYVTKPRIEAAITGWTPAGERARGNYKFTDEFPMAEGFEENAEFFTLTYENPVAIGHNRAFERVALLLWLRAGSEGRCIDVVPQAGWDVAKNYGILFDLDRAADFAHAVSKEDRLRVVFAVTDDDRRFQSVAGQLPQGIEVVRLYESYLSNFRFTGIEP